MGIGHISTIFYHHHHILPYRTTTSIASVLVRNTHLHHILDHTTHNVLLSFSLSLYFSLALSLSFFLSLSLSRSLSLSLIIYLSLPFSLYFLSLMAFIEFTSGLFWASRPYIYVTRHRRFRREDGFILYEYVKRDGQ